MHLLVHLFIVVFSHLFIGQQGGKDGEGGWRESIGFSLDTTKHNNALLNFVSSLFLFFFFLFFGVLASGQSGKNSLLTR